MTKETAALAAIARKALNEFSAFLAMAARAPTRLRFVTSETKAHPSSD
jgi:hypothetical protein